MMAARHYQEEHVNHCKDALHWDGEAGFGKSLLAASAQSLSWLVFFLLQ